MPFIKNAVAIAKEVAHEVKQEETERIAEAYPTNLARDFQAEARGKTRCQMFSATLQSPVLQQYFYTKETTLEEIMAVLKQVADVGTTYTFEGK